MGKSSGVPCFDLDAMIDKSGRFVSRRTEIFSLVPAATGEDKERALLFKINGDFDKKATEFFGKLGFSGRHSFSLSSDFGFLLDAVSGDDGEAVVKKKDSLALVRATYELALEHTHDEKLIGELQEKLDNLQAQPDLKYSLPDMMEEAGIAESGKPSRLLPFDFDKLLEFFPFPLSSPQLPGASKEDVDKWLNELPDVPLAEDEESSVVVLFFKDFDHFKKTVIDRSDKGICQDCSKPISWEEYAADHIKPHSKGGKTGIENGQVLCRECNLKKGAK